MKKTIYKITILNWEKYNSKARPGHPSIMISKRFFDDAKIQSLTGGAKLLFLGLMLRRGDVDTTFVEGSHEDLVRFAGGSGQVVCRLLRQLEAFQLVTYEIFEPLIKLKESNIREEKLNEFPEGSKSTPSVEPEISFFSHEVLDPPKKPRAPKKIPPPANKETWDSYCTAYKKRWGVDPLRNAKVNTAIANFVKRVGEHDAPEIIEFFVGHNDGLYIKTAHDLSLAVRDAEALRTQWLRGTTITGRDVRDFEKRSVNQETLRALRAGELAPPDQEDF